MTMIMYFNELEHELRKEYVLFDLNAIVASVGGSMGLFLGFSCLGMGTYLCNGMWKKIKPSFMVCLI